MSDWTPIAKEYDPLKAGSIDGTDEEPHDRAVWRAMLARYKPNKGVVGDPHLTLFVSRLNLQTTEEKLKEVFSRYGDIKRLRLVRDLITGFSKGYAFIEYKEERSLLKAHRDASKFVVDQTEIFVDFELERTLKGWIPRRLGGGLGGKKESGQLRFGGRDRPFRKPINLPAVKNDLYAERRAERKGSSPHERLWDRRNHDRDFEKDRDKRRRERERSQSRDHSERKKDTRNERDRERKNRDRERERKETDRHRERSRERDCKRHKDEDWQKRQDKIRERN
ncbi:U11/U12 small nuclear ribonucleoprotein 35 kDa protein [Latimeria chalumnae]|uniref:U11/U12 small nuclear ribonucleoprotein 35 kDa protein n=1 Tax=Latimeria chalumnae TaxID=7897 RepID=H3BCB2_LATCH|nr:PREDICTED: U11/U12 small nuclear ribonucleoprotein 35 kDa protein [Latimeria chalumnae]XP_005989004.1 PREDICTED: U11/U12 small nuclear ribonucleoprotein 35 kDa protein [Latimeria chalumnae]XP_005989005.1 PREDICTED: U11/U12 small nuclear ribonucleoprotein 35 kDa protein [Latimeria chalumnae]XP_014339721.1 PREDICTED: U11/U12 small nuclear ribonucleoprotein 35 kDa protein [Latimeria chalumnae]|eukprot:XP_005989003.1 PREDICTED: U11/U12 small nuclear ribonucleoprotein 35 kDa protein [Latimeria chalumnae]